VGELSVSLVLLAEKLCDFFQEPYFDSGAVASASLVDAANKTKYFALYLVAF